MPGGDRIRAVRRFSWRGTIDGLAALAAITAAGLMLWLTFAGSRNLQYRAGQPGVENIQEAVSLDGAHTEGAANARVAMIQFSDFACPYCGTFARETLPELRRQYIATGRIRFGFRHLPLRGHPRAMVAAVAAECAAQEGRFWSLHDRLFIQSADFDIDGMKEAAHQVGLDDVRFAACLTDGRAAAEVGEDIAHARVLSVTGTPSFVIGVVQPDGLLQVRRQTGGARPYSEFRTALETILREAATR